MKWPGKRVGLICATACLLCVPAGFAIENSGDSAVSSQIAAEEPHYPAPTGVGAAENPVELPPLQLLGISLRQGDKEVVGERPELDGSLPLTVVAYWLPSIRIESSLPIDVTFWDHLNLISNAGSFRAGPEANTPPWEIGSVYQQRYEVSMRAVSGQFSGQSYLVIAPKLTSATGAQPVPMQLLRVTIRPAALDAPLPESLVKSAFPTASVSLGKHFRMGFGAGLSLEVPAEWPAAVRRLGIVSSLSYRAVPQGERACRIIVNESLPDERAVELISGTMTARCDYDLFKATDLDHDRAPIFESRDSALLNPEGRPTLLHTYYGTIDLKEPVAQIKTLRFVCDSETVLDVYGVVPLTD